MSFSVTLYRLLAIFCIMLLAGCAPAPATARFQGVEYRLADRQGDIAVYESAAGDRLVVESTGGGAQVTAQGQAYQVSGSARETTVAFPDGRELTRLTQNGSSAGLAPFDADVTLEDWAVVDDLRALVFAQPERGAARPAVFITGLLLIALGALGMVKPRWAWLVREGWRYQNLEPSEAFLLVLRVTGAVSALIGLLLVSGVWR
jgi:hypothetical protein